MKKLFSILKLQTVDSFIYRGDILLYALSGIAHPLIMLAIWLAVIGSGGNMPLSRQEFIQYYLFLLVVKVWTGAWAAPFIGNDIRLGKISPNLVRPVSFFLFPLGNNIGEKVVKTIFVGPVFLGLAFLFNQRVPGLSVLEWGMFTLSWVGAIVLAFIVDLCVGFAAFWFEDAEAIEDANDFLMHIFSGQLIPIYAFPLILQRVSILLPFRYTLSLPLEILLQKLSSQEFILGMFIQLVWIAVGAWLVHMLWRHGLRRYSAAGA